VRCESGQLVLYPQFVKLKLLDVDIFGAGVLLEILYLSIKGSMAFP